MAEERNKRPTEAAFQEQLISEIEGQIPSMAEEVRKGAKSFSGSASRMLDGLNQPLPENFAVGIQQLREELLKDLVANGVIVHDVQEVELMTSVTQYLADSGTTEPAQIREKFSKFAGALDGLCERFSTMFQAGVQPGSKVQAMFGAEGPGAVVLKNAFIVFLSQQEVDSVGFAAVPLLNKLANFHQLTTEQDAEAGRLLLADVGKEAAQDAIAQPEAVFNSNYNPAREAQLTDYIAQVGARQDALEAEKGQLDAADYVKYSVLYARAYQALAHNAGSFEDATFYLDLMMKHVEYLRQYDPDLLPGYTQENVERADFIGNEEQFVAALFALEQAAASPTFNSSPAVTAQAEVQSSVPESEAPTVIRPKAIPERIEALGKLMNFDHLVRFIKEQDTDHPLYQGLLEGDGVQPDALAEKVQAKITDGMEPEQQAEADALLAAIETHGSMLRQDDLLSPAGPIQSLADLKAFVEGNQAIHGNIYAELAEHIDPPNQEAFSTAINERMVALEEADAGYHLKAELMAVKEAFDRVYDYHLAAEQGLPVEPAQDLRMANLQDIDTIEGLKDFVEQHKGDAVYKDLPDPVASPDDFIQALEGKPQIDPEVLMLKAQFYEAKVNRLHDETDETLLQDVQDLYQAAYYYHLLDQNHYPGDERYADKVAVLCTAARGKGNQISSETWLGRAAYERRAARKIPEADAQLTASEKAQALNSLGSALQTPYKREQRELRLRRQVRGAEKLARTAEGLGDRVSAARRASWSNVRMMRTLADATDRVEVNAGINAVMDSLRGQGIWSSLPLAVYMNPVRYPGIPYKSGTYVGAYNYRALSAAVKSQAALVNPASYSQQELYAQYEALTTDPVDTPVEASIRAQMMYVEAMDRKTKGDLKNCDGPEQVEQYLRVSLSLASNLYAQESRLKSEGKAVPEMYKEVRNQYIQHAKALAATGLDFDLGEPMQGFINRAADIGDSNKQETLSQILGDMDNESQSQHRNAPVDPEYSELPESIAEAMREPDFDDTGDESSFEEIDLDEANTADDPTLQDLKQPNFLQRALTAIRSFFQKVRAYFQSEKQMPEDKLDDKPELVMRTDESEVDGPDLEGSTSSSYESLGEQLGADPDTEELPDLDAEDSSEQDLDDVPVPGELVDAADPDPDTKHDGSDADQEPPPRPGAS